MTLAAACALRDLPTRQVQELWGQCHDVDDVRAALEEVAAT
jgi:hypothetical protein